MEGDDLSLEDIPGKLKFFHVINHFGAGGAQLVNSGLLSLLQHGLQLCSDLCSCRLKYHTHFSLEVVSVKGSI